MRPLIVALLVLALVPFGAQPARAGTGIAPALRESLDAALNDFVGEAGVIVTGPNVRYAYNEDAVFPAASLYKLGVMVEAYRQAEAHVISLDRTSVTVTWDDVSVDPSFTYPGTSMSVRAAVERIITVSDNGPAHALLRLLDTHNVNDTMRGLGMVDTRINTELPAEEQVVDYNTTSARDLETLFNGLVNGTVVSPQASAEMLAVLTRQRINDRLPSGLPSGAHLAHKTGNLDAVAHDVGVLTTAFGPRVIVVLTKDFWSYDDVVRLSARVAAAAYEIRSDLLAADVRSTTTGVLAGPGESALVALTVTNTSTFDWGPPVRLGAHWLDAGGNILRWDSARVSLPALAPGQSATVRAEDQAPSEEGVYVIEWEVVDDGLAWSGDAARVRVVVEAVGFSVVAP